MEKENEVNIERRKIFYIIQRRRKTKEENEETFWMKISIIMWKRKRT